MKTPKAPRELVGLTLQLLAAGQLKEAQRACRKAIQARPDLPEAHLLLSEIHHQGGDAAKAREAADRALRLRPGWSEAHVALGNAEALAGKAEAAEQQFRAAIAAGSAGGGAHANLGHVLARQGRLEAAREAYELAAARDPDSIELQLNVATILNELGHKTRALECLRAAAQRFPDSAQVQFALGNQRSDLGQHDEAIAAYRRALEMAPSFLPAALNLARALFAAGRQDEAIDALRLVIHRDPQSGEARERLLRVLHVGRRFKDMEAAAREAMAADPAAPFYPHQLAVSLWWQARHEEAMAAFGEVDRRAKDRTMPAYQEAKLDEATWLLALGRWRAGWEAYRWRATRDAWRVKFPRLIDDPRRIAALERPARILVVGDQGLGDDIFFLRFAPALRKRGHRLYGLFGAKLVPLLAESPGLFDGLAPIETPEAIEADAVIVCSDLPAATGQEVAPPLSLAVNAERRAALAARLAQFGPPPYIGVTWRAGVLADERKVPGVFYLEKAVPTAGLAAVLRPLDARVVVLQRRPSIEDQAYFCDALGRAALDLSEANDDLRDSLALLSLLDEYVGVSNTNTHLVAALQGRARVLVPFPPEWRWGLRGDRSPWFPSFDVYRQSLQGDWNSALAVLAADLRPSDAA